MYIYILNKPRIAILSWKKNLLRLFYIRGRHFVLFVHTHNRTLLFDIVLVKTNSEFFLV